MQPVKQLSQNLTSPSVSYAQAAKKAVSTTTIQPIPIPTSKAFKQAFEALAAAPKNEQWQFAAIKLILNLCN